MWFLWYFYTIYTFYDLYLKFYKQQSCTFTLNYNGQYNGKQKMKVAKIHRNKYPKSKRVAPRRTHSRNQLTSTSSNGHSRGKSFKFICTIVNDVKSFQHYVLLRCMYSLYFCQHFCRQCQARWWINGAVRQS